MTVIYVLIPIAIILTCIGIYLFFWAVKSEQFTDLEKQGLSILFDENEQKNVDTTNNTPEKNNHSEQEESSTHLKTPPKH